jgi:hypothetical protein
MENKMEFAEWLRMYHNIPHYKTLREYYEGQRLSIDDVIELVKLWSVATTDNAPSPSRQLETLVGLRETEEKMEVVYVISDVGIAVFALLAAIDGVIKNDWKKQVGYGLMSIFFICLTIMWLKG